MQDEGKWLPIARIARTIPYGYMQDPEDDLVLQPIQIELDSLETAKNHLKQYSYREVAHWLSNEADRYISHVGLMKRVKNEKKRIRDATSIRRWAEYAKAAFAKAEELEKRQLSKQEE
jgi:hypothetical protein